LDFPWLFVPNGQPYINHDSSRVLIHQSDTVMGGPLEHYSRKQVDALLGQAEQFARSERQWPGYAVPWWTLPVQWFYRDSFQDSEDVAKASGVIRKYRKNKNGDPSCPINDRIDGLHFSCNVDYKTCEPFGDYSPYGNRRLLIPAAELTRRCPNLFFADFFCYGYKHHVCLVMTKTGSAEDEFCRTRLPELDWENNPFLLKIFTDDAKECFGIPKHYLHVELFFADDLHMDFKKARWEDIKFWSRHSQNTGGRRGPGLKPSDCRVCNLREITVG
jgi:hypothetical protein